MRIAIDAMGGDFAPGNNLQGVQLALKQFPDIHKIILVGREQEVRAGLADLGLTECDRLEVRPASQVVTMSDQPTTPLRKKKDSSITVTSRLLKEKEADAIISAGHTGAAVAATVVQNRMLTHVDRPGIAGTFPSTKGRFIALDVGANVDCKPLHLAQFALLGEIYAELIMGLATPSVGVLSVGAEEGKGNALTRESLELINRHVPLQNFLGNVEGRDLFSGKVDVVICDGFVGNILLKTAEDLALSMASVLKRNLKKTPWRRLGALMSRRAFSELREITNHEEYGGAPLLGINGTCIIAHGSSSPKAIMNAFRVARAMLLKKINHEIEHRFAAIDWTAAGRPATSTPQVK